MMETTCGVCGRVFPTKKGLANHLRGASPCAGSSGGDVEMDDAVPGVTCTKCGRIFPTRKGLMAHSWQACDRPVQSCDNGAGVPTNPDPGTPGDRFPQNAALDSYDAGFSPSRLAVPPVLGEDDMEGYYPPPEDSDGDLEYPAADASGEDLEVYVNALSAAGTYDPAFVSRHLDRPACPPMTAGELESIRFLRATETGNGCSRRQVQALLGYARTLGGRANSLPTSYYNLWNGVEEVTTDAYQPLSVICMHTPLYYIRKHNYTSMNINVTSIFANVVCFALILM